MDLEVSPSGNARWVAGFAAAAMFHLCGLVILTRIPAPVAPVQPALMLDLAPATQAPATPPLPDTTDQQAAPEPTTESAPEAQQPPPPERPTEQQAPQPEPPEAHQEPPVEPPSEPTKPEPEPQPETPVAQEPPPAEAPPLDIPIPAEPPLPAPPVPVPPPAPRPVAHPPVRPIVSPRPVLPVPVTRETTVAAQPAPAAQQVQPSAVATADWRARLLAHLNRFKRYPPLALMRHIQGVAYVHFVLMPDGSAQQVRLQTSSGAAMLDEEAIALITRAVPLPARPDTGPADLIVPVQFAVR